MGNWGVLSGASPVFVTGYDLGSVAKMGNDQLLLKECGTYLSSTWN